MRDNAGSDLLSPDTVFAYNSDDIIVKVPWHMSNLPYI
jgi:hypothetical protein